jgi:hypothetical protein
MRLGGVALFRLTLKGGLAFLDASCGLRFGKFTGVAFSMSIGTMDHDDGH